MSVAFSHASTDQLAVTLPTLTIGTGDFTYGLWVKITDTPAGTSRRIFRMNNNTDTVGQGIAGLNSDILQIAGLKDVSPVYTTTGTNLTFVNDTWYYMVIDRSGTTFTFRAFDDSTSTTPVASATSTALATDLTDMAKMYLGYTGSGNAFGMEMESVKVLTGVSLSNAECRTESQSYAIVKTGATDAYTWKLTNIDADTDGLNEASGSGYNLSNTGVVAGATTPTQLSGAAIGTAVFFGRRR
jgi:hypothetical protein